MVAISCRETALETLSDFMRDEDHKANKRNLDDHGAQVLSENLVLKISYDRIILQKTAEQNIIKSNQNG